MSGYEYNFTQSKSTKIDKRQKNAINGGTDTACVHLRDKKQKTVF